MVGTLTWFSIGFGSLALTAAGVLTLLRTPVGAMFLDPIDKANAMHASPVPRIGGLPLAVVVLIVFLSTGVAPSGPLNQIVVAAAALALFSLVDDRKGLSALVRLVAHVAAAWYVLFVLSEQISQLVWTIPATLVYLLLGIAIVWSINLYNFMDGANGLAGAMGVVGFGALSLIAASPATAAYGDLSLLCCSLSGACAGFLLFNFPRGLVFLGDVGSVFLGIMASSIAIYGALADAWPLWLPMLCFSPFIVDATVTLVRRTLRGERVWQAHREHFYHRLILVCGWSHVRTTIVYIVLMVAAAAHALIWQHTITLKVEAMSIVPPISILIPWVLTYVTLLSVAEWQIRRHTPTKTTMSANDDRGAK